MIVSASSASHSDCAKMLQRAEQLAWYRSTTFEINCAISWLSDTRGSLPGVTYALSQNGIRATIPLTDSQVVVLKVVVVVVVNLCEELSL